MKQELESVTVRGKELQDALNYEQDERLRGLNILNVVSGKASLSLSRIDVYFPGPSLCSWNFRLRKLSENLPRK